MADGFDVNFHPLIVNVIRRMALYMGMASIPAILSASIRIVFSTSNNW